jgi:bla regulator protein blaR1
MIIRYLSAKWAACAPAIGNHLWQTTLFVVIAGLLTLLLQKNHARIRYWIWLAASLKFLIPFTLLSWIGSHLAWAHVPTRTNAGLYFSMEVIGQPFTQMANPSMPGVAQPPSTSLAQFLPAVLLGAWLCGLLAVLFVWVARWWRISVLVREALSPHDGREVETLRRLERTERMPTRMEILVSRASLEPGIFGIMRPVLLWPEGISERLVDGHLEAILRHELWHVRRRDNLTAAMHMLVQAIFWFHPFVWWLGARLITERERACDEAVLQSGSDRRIYAESILKICEFCVEAPLACVSGVTGADLKKRMLHIMTKNVPRKLDLTRKFLVSAVGLAAVAVPIFFGLLGPIQSSAGSQGRDATSIAPAFQVASIKLNKTGEPMAGFPISGRPAVGMLVKPDRFLATNVSVHMLIQRFYDVREDQISGGPSWLGTEKYDIEAKLDKSAVDKLGGLDLKQRAEEYGYMLRALLADNFKLKFHRETREQPVYALVVGETGPKLQKSKTNSESEKARNIKIAPDGLTAEAFTMASLGDTLSERLDRKVVDRTGLSGNYDILLHWAESNGKEAIIRAVQEQLGLKLEPQKATVEILVIDHAEKPSEN